MGVGALHAEWEVKSFGRLLDEQRGNQSVVRVVQLVASESEEIICCLAKAVHQLAPYSWLGQRAAVPALSREPGTKVGSWGLPQRNDSWLL